jgi:uncharacterized ferritin-like protein (DUF455 family)
MKNLDFVQIDFAVDIIFRRRAIPSKRFSSYFKIWIQIFDNGHLNFNFISKEITLVNVDLGRMVYNKSYTKPDK